MYFPFAKRNEGKMDTFPQNKNKTETSSDNEHRKEKKVYEP